MIRKILIWTCLLILLVSNVSAFFETPSNNILVQNNLYNGTFELNEINTTDLYVNGTQILPLNYVPYIGATTNVNLNNKNLTTTGDISANELTLTSNIMFDSSSSDLYFKNTDASYNRGFIFQSNSIAGYVTLLDLSKNGGADFQDLDITTTSNMFTQDIMVSRYIKGVDSTDMTFQIEAGQEFHFQKHDGISSYRDIFVLGTDADFKSRDIITLGDINADEIALTDDVNAVNGKFSGNINASNFYDDGVLLTNFDETKLFNTTKVIRNSNNTVTIYNPISYYYEGDTIGEIKLIAPYMCSDCYVTMEVIARAENSYLNYHKYVFSQRFNNGVFNTSSGSTEKTFYSITDNSFSSFDDIGFLTTDIGISFGSSFFAFSNLTNLEVIIKKVIISGTNTSLDWGNDWTTETVNTPFTSPSHTQGYLIKNWNSYNDGVGSGLDADKFGGLNYQNYIYGSNNNGLKVWSNSTNISSVSANDRTYFVDYYGSEDIPFPYSSGSPHNWMLTQSLTGIDGYSMQVISPSSDLGTQYARWGYPIPSWTGWLKYMFNETTTNSIFTGNHTQNGTINITDSIESGNPHMEGYMTETQSVAVVDTWYNLTWNGSIGYIQGFILTNNQTLTATESGLYHIMFDLSVQSTSGVDEIIAFRIINDDGEMIGTYKEATITKQNADEWIINDEYVELKEGHNLTMQYLGSSTDLSIQTSNTYSDLDPYHGHAQITKTPLRVS